MWLLEKWKRRANDIRIVILHTSAAYENVTDPAKSLNKILSVPGLKNVKHSEEERMGKRMIKQWAMYVRGNQCCRMYWNTQVIVFCFTKERLGSVERRP